jgi:hypothetical protein
LCGECKKKYGVRHAKEFFAGFERKFKKAQKEAKKKFGGK